MDAVRLGLGVLLGVGEVRGVVGVCGGSRVVLLRRGVDDEGLSGEDRSQIPAHTGWHVRLRGKRGRAGPTDDGGLMTRLRGSVVRGRLDGSG